MLHLTGQRFGRWTAIKDVGTKNKQRIWLCKCECGAIGKYPAKLLTSGQTKSCGCLIKDVLAQRNFKHGHHQRDRTTREYRIWTGMKQRCLNPRNPRYKDYGGRGVKICEEWENDFPRFLSDMGECPQEMTIDRINNDGHYSPTNCRWATDSEQRRNGRRNHFLAIAGKSMCIKDWARHSGTDHRKIHARLKLGWSPDQAVFHP